MGRMGKWEWIESKSEDEEGRGGKVEGGGGDEGRVQDRDRKLKARARTLSDEGVSGEGESAREMEHGKIVRRTDQLTSAPLAINSRPICDVSDSPRTCTRGRCRLTGTFPFDAA